MQRQTRHRILKTQLGVLPAGIDLSDSVENEFLCMNFCRAMGMDVAEVEIADFEEVRSLVVNRFDRRWTKDGRLIRLPQEDFCQALTVPPSQKYQTRLKTDSTTRKTWIDFWCSPSMDQRLSLSS